jgi:hypothetical protein
MFDTFSYEDDKKNNIERYPKAYKLAEDRHNLNIWTYDKAIIGTNIGEWKKMKETEEKEILNFIEVSPKVGTPDTYETLVKIGNFEVFTNFLKVLIGAEKEVIKESKNDK